MNYFATLNKDLLLVLLSKIRISDLNKMSKPHYNIKILIMRDENYEYLLRYFNTHFYNFIKNVKNIDGSDSWYNIYSFVKKFWIEVRIIGPSNSYHSDLFYLYEIKCQYPKFYFYAKNINLNHCGFRIERESFNWSRMYDLLKKYSNYDYFKECSDEIKYEALRNEISHSLGLKTKFSQLMHDNLKLFLYITYYVHSSHKGTLNRTGIKTLYNFFIVSPDIYQLAIESMTSADLLSVLDNRSILDATAIEKFAQFKVNFDYCLKIFYEDLDSQLKSKQ